MSRGDEIFATRTPRYDHGMANPEHETKLREGVDAWNAWRRANRSIQPDLSASDLSYGNLVGVDFYGANLTQCNLSDSRLVRADLRAANLIWAECRNTDLSHALFSDAHLGEGDFKGSSFRNADFSYSDLTDAKFTATMFDGAEFRQSVLGATKFADVDLSLALDLDQCTHMAPSTIGIDTIYRSGGKIPDAFLRGCGVPDAFIAYAKSLVGSAIEFYSAFISYSTKDQDFADRLYADLQAKNVRCWFAPEDLKIGDKFRTRIDESIRLHDKLLLILSERSIASPWVEDEVESALERERRDGKLVLFPIRIDDAVMNTDVAWASSLRRTRHIGDFRNWKDHDAYSKAFERLLRDLKSDATAVPKP